MPLQFFETMAKAQKGYARLMDPVCKKWDLTRNELDVLLFLADNPELNRAVDIVNKRGMAKSHVSLSTTNLESRGLLIRKVDPEDRRTVRLLLTEGAKEITDAGQRAQKRFLFYLHQGVTQEQIDTVQDFAQKVSENVANIERII